MGTPELAGCMSVPGGAERHDCGDRLRLPANVHRALHEPHHCPSRSGRQPLLRRPFPPSNFRRRGMRQNTEYRIQDTEFRSQKSEALQRLAGEDLEGTASADLAVAEEPEVQEAGSSEV